MLLAADRIGKQARAFGLVQTRDAIVELKHTLRAAKTDPDRIETKVKSANAACTAELGTLKDELTSRLAKAPDNLTAEGHKICPGTAKKIERWFWGLNIGNSIALLAIPCPAILVIKKFMAKPVIGMPGAVEMVVAGWVLVSFMIVTTMAVSMQYRPGKFMSRKEACRTEYESYLKAKEKIQSAFEKLESALVLGRKSENQKDVPGNG
jgi:hypothetical protein